MTLKDVLTSDELNEVLSRLPEKGVMKVPEYIYNKIRKSGIKLLLTYEKE